MKKQATTGGKSFLTPATSARMPTQRLRTVERFALRSNPYQKDFSAEVDARDYRKKWDLGDFVTIVDEETGIIEDHQITEVKETYEKGTRKVEPVLAKSFSGITDRIKKNAASPVSYQGKQGEPGGKRQNAKLSIRRGWQLVRSL